MNDEIELGDKVKDLISGYEGIAVAKTVFINGCVQFTIVRHKKGERPPIEGDPSIDATNLIIVEKGCLGKQKRKHRLEVEEEEETGGKTTYQRFRGY